MESSIQKYQALVETVRQGSFTAAAERLGYSQSGVSRMVGDLERGWGVTLLERGRGGVRLTSDGEQLLPAVQSVCEAERRLQMRVGDLRGLAAGIIRIGAFSSVATHWLPPVIKRFQADYPAIEYELLVGAFGEIRAWCEEGRVDLAFLPDYVRSDLLQTTPAQSGEYLAVLPEGHPLAKNKAVSVARLAREPFILLEKTSDRSVSEIFERAGVEPQVRRRRATGALQDLRRLRDHVHGGERAGRRDPPVAHPDPQPLPHRDGPAAPARNAARQRLLPQQRRTAARRRAFPRLPGLP